MAAPTTAMATSFKKELMTGTHNFAASGGNTFKIALFKAAASVAGTWNATATNYGAGSGGPTTANMGTDELATGSGYTAAGVTLTNVDPSTSGTTALTNFTPNPSWTSATFTTSGCMIYNSTASGKCVAVYSFGGDQTVTSGTFTVQMPVADASNAIIRIA